jgi:hypothetical protein
MQYQNSFIENFRQGMQAEDKEGLKNLFVGKIANLISFDKKNLVKSLQDSGAPIKSGISNEKLSKYVVEGIESGNDNVVKPVTALIIKKEYGFSFSDDGKDGKAGAGATGTSGNGKKVNWDQIDKIVGTVGKGMQSVMGFAKDVQTLKGGKTSTEQVKEQVDLNGNKGGGGSGTPMSVGKKLAIGGGIVVGVVGTILLVRYFIKKSEATSTAPAAAPQAAPAVTAPAVV